jgi:hypothetical protein
MLRTPALPRVALRFASSFRFCLYKEMSLAPLFAFASTNERRSRSERTFRFCLYK